MNKEQMRISIAESLGRAKHYKVGTRDGYECKFCGKSWHLISGSSCKYSDDCPNYPESLDACREFEDKLTEEEYTRYAKLLASDCETDETEVMDWHLIKIGKALPEQRCIAYLKTKGLWKEE